MNVPRRARVSLVLVCAVAACDAPGEARDVTEWHLSPEPTLQIGAAEGDEPNLLHDVSDVDRLSNGNVVVANAGSSEIRVFDPRGRHLRSLGSSGDGPGEFQTLSSARVMRGGSILAFDPQSRRISFFDASGDFLRSWSVEPLGRGVLPDRALPLDDGTVLVLHFRGHMPGDPSGLVRNSAPVVRYSAEGDPLRELVEVPGEEWFRAEASSGGTLMYLPFGTSGHLVVHGDRLYVGDGREGELRVYDSDGRIVEQVRLPGAARPVTPEDIRRVEARALEGVSDPDARRRREELHRAIPYPETMPALASLLVDEAGRLWVEEYRAHDGEPPRWLVLSAPGEPVAEVRMPEGFAPRWIGDGLVLGIARDELGVEYVRGYAITR
jgi:hypothetical protein